MVDRSIAPAYTPPSNFEFPKPEIYDCQQGSRCIALRIGEQPIVKVEWVFRSGLWYETQPGQALLTARLLKEGSSSFTSKQIASALDQYGAFIEVSAGFDYTHVTFYVQSQNWQQIEAVAEEILFLPTFPEREVMLAKQQQLQQLRVNSQKNNFIASRILRSRLLHGTSYGHVLEEERIQSIQTDELKNFYQSSYCGKVDVFVTGRFDDQLPKRLVDLINRNQRPSVVKSSETVAENSSFDVDEEKADSLQTSIFMGSRSVNRHEDEYPEVLLLNEVFGGYFGSRLMQNIREDKGYTYGIYSHLAAMKHDAYFFISTDVKKERKGDTVREIELEINRIKEELIGYVELQRAKNYLKGSILNSITNPFAITEKWKNILLYELGDRFYSNIFEKVDAANPTRLQELANEVLFTKPLSRVIVG